jgi:GNAT superfamily N-acetyltransferase
MSNPTHRLVQAQTNHLHQVWMLYEVVIKNLLDHNILQWDTTYPSQNYIAQMIDAQDCWIYCSPQQEIIASVILNEWQDPQWSSISWHTLSDQVWVIHALVIQPNQQGQGLGTSILQMIEKLALQHGYLGIRLDAFNGNHRVHSFYQDRGYKSCGTVQLSNKPLDHQIYQCYDKIL